MTEVESSDSEKAVREGWGWPVLAKKAHYFVGMTSLCGKWMFGGEKTDTQESSPNDCLVCRRILTQRRKDDGAPTSWGTDRRPSRKRETT